MKRSSQGGDSPGHKFKFFGDSDEDKSDEDFEDFNPNLLSQSQSSCWNVSLNIPSQSSSGTYQAIPFTHSSPPYSDSQPFPDVLPRLESDGSSSEADNSFSGWQSSQSPDPSLNNILFEDEESDTSDNIKLLLENVVKDIGASKLAAAVFENHEVKHEIVSLLFKESHDGFKSSLKSSKLTASKQDRKYLLSLTPRTLCEELRTNSNSAFQLIIQGLLGIGNPEDIFNSQHLLNCISLIYSTLAKTINRKATGYALLQTTVARDGGLREDSLKMFCQMVTPRTSQRYDKSVLATNWDAELLECLGNEKYHFERIKKAESKVEQMLHDGEDDEAVIVAKDELEFLLDTVPPQLQKVWDNLNLRTKHRYERAGDKYSDSNLDWMASLWIKDRINANHMQHIEGMALKDHLSIKDFVASDKEKDFIFSALVFYFSHRLVERHPMVFKSLAKSARPHRPHQFQEEMSESSTEFTGSLFTKSESHTEDLIDMMSTVQLNVHKFKDSNGASHCFERKVVSGDNKTEKNMHYGILRSTMLYSFKVVLTIIMIHLHTTSVTMFLNLNLLSVSCYCQWQ